jgi:hypothetical protein
MDLPKKKNAPKLPPKPTGGGAAARRKQFDKERGLDIENEHLPENDVESESTDERNTPTEND